MTTTQTEVRTDAEPLTMGFVFADDDYTMNEFQRKLDSLDTLLALLITADNPEGVDRNVYQFQVRRVSLASPLEVWLSLGAGGATVAVLLAKRLVDLARDMSKLRVDVKRDDFEAMKYDHARRLLRAITDPRATFDPEEYRLISAAWALMDLEALAIEASGDIEQQVVVIEPPAQSAPPLPPDPMTPRELRKFLRETLRELADDDQPDET